MSQKLLAAFQHSPPPYETTGLAFWDDEYISGSMLKAHLDPLSEGATRPHGFLERSAAWIASLCPGRGRLLDIGCGPGLYAQHFAKDGFQVTGMDISRRSIAYAKEQAQAAGQDIKYLCRDYLTMEFADEFDAAVLIYCDFGVLSPENRALLLQKIHTALKPGGLFLVDAFTPARYGDFRQEGSAEYQNGGFWSPQPYVLVQRRKIYEGHVYLEQHTVVTETDCRTYNLWNHAFTREELEQDLCRAGFEQPAFYGDAAGAPVREGDPTVCAVARKKG